MEAAVPVPNPQPPAAAESGGGCLPALVRLTWIFGGIALIYCALFIAQDKGTFVTELLLPFLALGLIAVRFVDIRFLKGETLDNKPATLKHWRSYALKILIAAAALFALAKFAAHKSLL